MEYVEDIIPVKEKNLNNNGEHVNVKALFNQSIVGPIKSSTNACLVTDDKSLQAKIDTLNNGMNNLLIRLKLKQTQFLFKAQGWRTSRKKKSTPKAHRVQEAENSKEFSTKKKKRKCLRRIKSIKQVRITTNTFHNQWKVKSSLSKQIFFIYCYK